MALQHDRLVRIQSLLLRMPLEVRTRWCNPDEFGCGCMGCANVSGGLSREGVTEAEWREALDTPLQSFVATDGP